MAALRARRGGAAGGAEGGSVRVFHSVSSLADPDHESGHQPRPLVTIRQHGRLAAVVGLMVGPTTRLPPDEVRSVRRPIAQHRAVDAQRCWVTGRRSCAVGLRDAAAQCDRSRLFSSCAGSAAELRTLWRAVGCAYVCGSSDRRAGDSDCRRPGGSGWTECPVLDRRMSRGRACGRAAHDPDHGLRVLIVTVVGGPWSVVRSGLASCLEVSTIRSDLGV